MDSSSDDEDDNVQPTDLKPTQKALHNAVFKAWATRNIKSRAFAKPKNAAMQIQHDSLSVHQIMGQQNLTAIVDEARQYQMDLFDRAKHENTIAVLDTGTGKTLIAVLLLRHVIEEELDDRQQGKPHRIAFFLVPSVNLVFQQHAVLETNLDHSTTHIYGGMLPDTWNREQWQETFKAHKAIVCTADILRMCLEHGFITMDQINLLILDEAHHAKAGHAYSVIMTEHYRPLSIERRPRVFGMTASPVDIKSGGMDIIAAAKELEATLHSKIATINSSALLMSITNRPVDQEEMYPAAFPQPPSNLRQTIQENYGHHHFVAPMVSRAQTIAQHLGPWAGDMFWRVALEDKIESKSDSALDRFVGRGQKVIDSTVRDQFVAKLKELLLFVSATELRRPVPHPGDVSRKVICLAERLGKYFGAPNDNRCLVFVKERVTAAILAAFFQAQSSSSIRPAVLVGAQSSDTVKSTIRQQILTLAKFRQGEVNCLFATSVAEEGLDIPSCNVVIRFDPCETMIQYIQSRGRARHRDSHFIHMIECGNLEHRNLLDNCQQSESLMRSFCARLPDDRHLTTYQDILDDPLEAGAEVFKTEKGALLTLSDSMRIVTTFSSTLPVEEDELSTPYFIVTSVGSQFISEVLLPSCSPVSGVRGQVKRRKQWARFSAAFETCKLLLRNGLLDDHLRPTGQRPILRQAALAVNLRSSSAYAMRNKPDWKQAQHPIQPLYGIIITIDSLDRPCQSVIMLSRRYITDLPSFPIYLNSGKSSDVHVRGFTDPLLAPDFEALQLLTRFTLRIFKDLFNKTYEEEPDKMPYWIAPSCSSSLGDDIRSNIDWQSMHSCCIQEELRWTPDMDPAFLINKFLVDPFDGGTRYFTRDVASHLKADDISPLFGPHHRRTILQDTLSLWKKAKNAYVGDMTQPVVMADKVLHRRNLLARCTVKEASERSHCFICPQPLRISRLSTALVATAYVLPAIIYKVESQLIAEEACELLGLHLQPTLALEALTKDTDVPDDEADEEAAATNFHHGMGNNYERLEFLGDTFLKMATTIAVYIKNPADNEHEFHVKRMVQLCNQNLYNHALDKKLYEFIRSKPFSRRTWYPAGITLQAGKGANRPVSNDTTHHLGMKTIADVCEAFIGAAYLSHNRQHEWQPSDWTEAVKAVTVMVKSEQHDMMDWSDYTRAYVIPKWQKLSSRMSELHLAERVEKEAGYEFNNARLLHCAFNHPSNAMMKEGVPSYQQLEFLGDALLDMVCVNHLIYNYPDRDPSWLTEHKMAMVNNSFLGALCVKLGLQRHIRLTTPSLMSQIKEYCASLRAAEEAAEGAVTYWMTVSDPPKALADVVESYLGAMFLDSGFDYGQILGFFRKHMLAFFEDMTVYDTFATNHPVIKLERHLNEVGCHSHRIMVEEIPSDGTRGDEVLVGLVIHGAVVGGEHCTSSRYGKARCAKKALDELSELSVIQFKAKFGCDCKANGGV